MRSRISSKLIFASCVGYFDRTYYGFYVTSSRMLRPYWGEQNITAVELSECTSIWLWICMCCFCIQPNTIQSLETRPRMNIKCEGIWRMKPRTTHWISETRLTGNLKQDWQRIEYKNAAGKWKAETSLRTERNLSNEPARKGHRWTLQMNVEDVSLAAISSRMLWCVCP